MFEQFLLLLLTYKQYTSIFALFLTKTVVLRLNTELLLSSFLACNVERDIPLSESQSLDNTYFSCQDALWNTIESYVIF